MSLLKTKKVEVRESFLGLVTEPGKTAYDMKKMILDRLEKEKLDLKKCSGLGFHSVAGVRGGVQRFLRSINAKAKFVSCSDHLLNLSGVHASVVNTSAITFFGGIERLYTSFSSSNHPWEVLSSHVKVMMKRLITTCYEGIRAVKTGFQRVVQTLDSLIKREGMQKC